MGHHLAGMGCCKVLILVAVTLSLVNSVLSFRHEAVPDASLDTQDAALLEVFQVYPPPLSSTNRRGSTTCSYILMNHVFSNSAGRPYIGTYRPLCGNDWDIAVLNLSVISYGRQFDRLGSVWIGGTEVWRTCTAEPVWSGIHFTFSKDITIFKSLLQSSKPLIVDIGNYVVGPYNGSFNATLSIDFYRVVTLPVEAPPNEIIPLSKTTKEGHTTYFSLPDDHSSTEITIPKNSSQVTLEIFASGNGREEFWYSNVPNEYVETFGKWNISFLGQGTYREVMVFIDQKPVGVVLPFEVVFTGGICPGFWRPIVGHRTFDLPSYTIDLTPYIHYLRKGKHQIRFVVNGQPKTLQNWYVSGHLRIWYGNTTDTSQAMTEQRVDIDRISRTADITTVGKVSEDNTSFSVLTTVTRRDNDYTVDYQNYQLYRLLSNGSMILQSLYQDTDFVSPLSRGNYRIDLKMNETHNPDKTIGINATLKQTFARYTNITMDGPTIEYANVQSAGRLLIGRQRNLSQGNTSVLMEYYSGTRTYQRNVTAIGFDIVSDYERDIPVEMHHPGVGGIQFQGPHH